MLCPTDLNVILRSLDGYSTVLRILVKVVLFCLQMMGPVRILYDDD